jgi:RNA polymerase sigma factor (sigma-70 family)
LLSLGTLVTMRRVADQCRHGGVSVVFEPISVAGGEGASSFDDVFCGLLSRLYRRAVMLTGVRHCAEDAVHEVYLKLARHPDRLRLHPQPYAYAFAALMSVVCDSRRRERRQVLMAEVGPAVCSDAHGWDGGLERRSSELEALRLLGHLSVRQAVIVVLVDLDGYTIDQAAEVMEIHRGTVSRSRKRALERLRHVMDTADGGTERRRSGSESGGTQ